MALYMHYEGLKGNVTATGYEGMIALDFFGFGLKRHISMETGALANRETGKPTFRVITTGKRLDGASTGILREAVGGSAGKKVVVHLVATGSNGLNNYLTYTFHHCLPVLYRIVDTKSEASPAAERLYLSYTAVEVAYTDRGADNKALTTLRHGYDLAVAKNL